MNALDRILSRLFLKGKQIINGVTLPKVIINTVYSNCGLIFLNNRTEIDEQKKEQKREKY